MHIALSTRTLVAAGVLSLVAAPAFAAVTVTNNSGKTHEVIADLGAKENTAKIDAGKSADLDCPSGCEIRVDDSGYGLNFRMNEGKAVVDKAGMLAFAGQATKGMHDESSSSSSTN